MKIPERQIIRPLNMENLERLEEAILEGKISLLEGIETIERKIII